jgi:hypothetical protein
MQNPRAPMSGKAKGNQEGQPCEPLRHCAFAPALEHSSQSNKEEDDGTAGKNLQKHDRNPPA